MDAGDAVTPQATEADAMRSPGVAPPAPAALGGLAAALQALEVRRLLKGEGRGPVAREIYLNLATCELTKTDLRRKRGCRFDHQRWSIEASSAATLGDLYRPIADGAGDGRRADDAPDRYLVRARAVEVPGQVFARDLVCSRCSASRAVLVLSRRLEPDQMHCAACGGTCVVLGFTAVHRLEAAQLSDGSGAMPLRALGLLDGDVVTVTDAADRDRHLRIRVDADRGAASSRAYPSGNRRKVVVVGCGNIGSHLVPLLARSMQADELLLVDPDRYETRNLSSQDIALEHVGRLKVDVQAERVARIAPDLSIHTASCAFEDLPLGRLEGAVIAACLDSRIARLHVGRAAWRLGAPVVDAAVGANDDAPLARVTVVDRPIATIGGNDETTPCLECDWDDDDYDALEQTYPCHRDRAD